MSGDFMHLPFHPVETLDLLRGRCRGSRPAGSLASAAWVPRALTRDTRWAKRITHAWPVAGRALPNGHNNL